MLRERYLRNEVYVYIYIGRRPEYSGAWPHYACGIVLCRHRVTSALCYAGVGLSPHSARSALCYFAFVSHTEPATVISISETKILHKA